MTISYDKAADTLYITFARPLSKAEYVEVDGGILRIDENTKTIVGVTIPFFMERIAKKKRMEIREIGAVPFTDEMLELLAEA
jgi:uncharacterized protein YuzE